MLQKRGYFVAVNLMQISEQNENEIINVAKLAEKSNQMFYILLIA